MSSAQEPDPQSSSEPPTPLPGECDPGRTETEWAKECPTAPPETCVQGEWAVGGPDPDHTGFTLLSQSEHFAVYSDESPAGAQEAVDYLESVWDTYFGSPMFMREPLCDSAQKYKASIHVHSDWGLTGGSWAQGRMGMWIGTGGLKDHWGLAHEFAHGVQAVQGGQACGGDSNYCGWIHESHANFMAHQQAEYRGDMHCTELSVNAPHLYLGSTRDRYCNWQFMEYLKDRHCFSAVNAIWTGEPTNDPFTAIMKHMDWDITQANDFYGEWALHNITWDYQDSEPAVAGSDVDPGTAFRSSYGLITDTAKTERHLRLTRLEALDEDYATHRRFAVPYYWAPQRYGYNVIELKQDADVSEVSVRFRGVVNDGAASDWRWSLVATNNELTTSRYGSLQSGADGEQKLCVGADERLWLVVMATPSAQQQINWDQAYTTIPRYPYMVEFDGAWPANYAGGMPAECPEGTVRIDNGGGCGPSGLASSVFVGPHAVIFGGQVSGNARIEDHAKVFNGTVSGGTIGALSLIGVSGGFGGNAFDVSGNATVKTTFYPLGFFEANQSIAGNATLLGDVELRGADYALDSGAYSGIVSESEHADVGDDATPAPPYTWR